MIELTESEVSEIVRDLSGMVNAVEMAWADLPERWEQVDDYARGKGAPSLKAPWPGAPQYNVAVMRPKLAMATAFACSALTKANPYFIVRAGSQGAGRCDEVERHLHFALERGKLTMRLREASDVAQRRGKAIVRAEYVKPALPRQKSYIALDVIDPQDFLRYPRSATTNKDAIMVGHRFDLTVREIKKRQESGLYYKDVEVSGDSEITPSKSLNADLQSNMDNASRPDDENVVMRYCIFEHDGTLVEAEFDMKSNRLYRLAKYPYSMPNYFDFAFHVEYGKTYFENSKGSDLIGVQQYTNDIHSLLIWASLRAAFPPVFADNWALPSERMAPSPGEIVSLTQGGQAFSPTGRIDMAAFPQLLGYADNWADRVSRVSANGNGQYIPNATATQSSLVAQGQAVGTDEEATVMGFGLSDMAEFIVHDLLYTHHRDWMRCYADVLPKIEKKAFDSTYVYELNGESPVNTPDMMFSQVQALTGMLQSSPEIKAAFPDVAQKLFRAAVLSSSLIGKDSLLPSPEEELSLNDNQSFGPDGAGNPPWMDLPPDVLAGTGGLPLGGGGGQDMDPGILALLGEIAGATADPNNGLQPGLSEPPM